MSVKVGSEGVQSSNLAHSVAFPFDTGGVHIEAASWAFKAQIWATKRRKKATEGSLFLGAAWLGNVTSDVASIRRCVKSDKEQCYELEAVFGVFHRKVVGARC